MASSEPPDDLLLPTWVLLTESHKSEGSLTRLEAVAKWLREGGHVDARAPEDGYASGTLLMLASGWCHAPIVTVLLLHDADVDARNAKGNTALILACLQPQNDEVVQLLLDRGADVDQQSDRGNTALIGAALYGHDPTVRLLLDRRADPDLQDEQGNTALHCACSKGRDLVVQLLLIAGANVEMCEEEQGLTAYDLAERAGHAQIARRILRWQVHKLTASRETEAREAAEAQAAADEVDGARRRAGRARSRSGACAEPEAVSAEAAAEAEAMAARRAEELLVSEAAAEMLAAAAAEKPKSSSKAKKGKGKAKASASPRTSNTADDDDAAPSSPEASSSTSSFSAAADDALRAATREPYTYESVAAALDAHRALARPETVAEARALRDRLKEKRKKQSQKLRKAHGEAMALHGALQTAQRAQDAGAL